MRRREPTDDEVALWQEHTGGDKKIPAVKKIAAKAAKLSEPKKPQKISALASRPETKPQRFLPTGDMRDLDARNAQRLRRGSEALDATLDLHGMTRESAYTAFVEFILRQYEKGRRRLLVITGKGPSGKGILRQSLADWVNDPAVRSLILAYDKAQLRHGGDGAFYLLLKKHKAG